MIPIKIETLLEGRKVERNRIEYKEGFNPSEIVHTICGYANDIAGVDGGYLEDFIRESNSSLIEELNARSLEDLLVSEEVAEEKDEGIAIKNFA